MECSIFYNKNEHEHIQKKTFTKWINSVLAKKNPNYRIKNIYIDLRDGIKLMEIMEILTKSKLIIERKKEMQRVHCFANVASVLRFLSSKRKVKLVNINASDIVDGRPNIILGLVWQIILAFQIKNEEKFQSIALKDSNPARRQSLVKGTPKEALLAWSDKILAEKYGLEIRDFHVSWRNGIAFNAIIHNINPELIDFNCVRKRTSRENLANAFEIAEKYLNIPALLEPEDVDVEYPDEKSIMTYVAQFLENYSDQDSYKEEEKEALNEECSKLMRQIQILLSEIDLCLKSNVKRSPNSIAEEMQTLLPMLEKINELKKLQKSIEEILLSNSSAINSPNEQLKSMEMEFEEKLVDLHKWQWKIEKLIPETHAIFPMFECVRTCEEGVIFLRNISLMQIVNIEAAFVDRIKEAARIFPHLKESQNLSSSICDLPEVYLHDFYGRILIIEKELPRISAYFAFIEIFKLLNDETTEHQEAISKLMSGFGNFEILLKKYEDMKTFIEAKRIDKLKANWENLSKTGSVLINTFLTKKISSQMIINQCTQKISDDITTVLRHSEETIKNHKLLLQNWQILNEKRDKLLDWIAQANSILNQSKKEREEFLSPENNCDKIYQEYHKLKTDFPTIDTETTIFLQIECNSITTEWNSILSKFEKIRQQEKIDSLKKEYFDRIRRIEEWLDKSETMADRKVVCHNTDIETYIELLEAAMKNFDTVKNDLQSTVKIGEAMYKSNMSEQEVDEVLGALNVNKERFIKVRDKINAKLKKMKKLISAAIKFDKNMEEMKEWINSVYRLFEIFQESEDKSENQFFLSWVENYEKKMSEKKLKEIQDRKGENLKILQRIKEKIQNDVDTNDCETLLTNISKTITKIIKDSSKKRKENEFKHCHEKFKKLMYTIEDQIEDEENKINTEKNFSKILSYHEKFFGDEDKEIECKKILADMKIIKENLISEGADDNSFEYSNIIDEMEITSESTFSKASSVKESLITLPEQLNGFKEKISEMSQWIISLKNLSTKLDMSSNQIDLITEPSANAKENDMAPSAEEYKATLNEFQKLTNVSSTNINSGEELNKILADLVSSRPGLLLKEEEKQVEEICRMYEDIQPEITKVLHTAPVIAKSIEFKEEIKKRNLKLLELKENLEKITEQEDYEDFEDIFEQEQKLMESLNQEAPDILNEIAECKELQANSETSKIIASAPADLENTWNIVSETMKRSLIKLRETKEAWIRIETLYKEIESTLNKIETDINDINSDTYVIEDLESSLQQLEEIAQILNFQVLHDVDDLEETIEKEKNKLSEQKLLEIMQRKDKLSIKLKRHQDATLLKKEEVITIKNILEEFQKRNEYFKRIVDDIKNSVEKTKAKTDEIIDEEIIIDLKLSKETIVDLQKSQEDIYQTIIKNIQYTKTQVLERFQSTKSEQRKIMESLLLHIKELEERVQTYNKNLNKIKNLESLIHEELNLIQENIFNIESKKILHEQWKGLKPEILVKPIRIRIEHCQKKITEDLRNAVEHLNPENDEINHDFHFLTEQIEIEKNHLDEVHDSLIRCVDFLKHFQSESNKLQKMEKSATESLIKLNKNKQMSIKDKINAAEIVKDDICGYLETCKSLFQEIENQTDVFEENIVTKLVKEVETCQDKLNEELQKSTEMINSENINENKMNFILKSVNELDCKIDELEIQLSGGQIMFGDNEDLKNVILHFLSGLDDIKCSLEVVVSEKESLTKLTKDGELVNIQDKIKYIKSRIMVIEKEAGEKISFIDWLNQFVVDFDKISDSIQDDTYIIEDLKEKDIDDVSKELKSLKGNVDKLKNVLKTKKKVFPIFSTDNLQEISFADLFVKVENEFNNLNKVFEKEKKNINGLHEEWKTFDKKKTVIDENLSKLNKKINELQVKDCSSNELSLVEKDLCNFRQQLLVLEPDISNLNEVLKRLIERKPSLAKFNEDVVNSQKTNFEKLILEIDNKTENLILLQENAEEFNKSLRNVQEKVKSLKDKLRIETSFGESNSMLEYFKLLNEDIQNVEEELEIDNRHVEHCLMEVKSFKKIFPDLSFTSLENNQDKLKLEIDSFQNSLKKLLKDMKNELEFLDYITKRIHSLKFGINELIDSLNNNSLVSLEDKEGQLKSLKDKKKEITEMLKEKHLFLNLESQKIEINDIFNLCDKAEEIIIKLKNQMSTFKKEKDVLFTRLSECKERFLKSMEEKSKYNQMDNRSDKAQLDTFTGLNNIQQDLIKDVENYEKQAEALFQYLKDPETNKLTEEYKNLRFQINNSSKEINSVKERIAIKIKEDYEKAKKEHEQWMNEVEKKIKNTELNCSSYGDIQAQLMTLNDLIGDMSEGERKTDNVRVTSGLFRQINDVTHVSEDQEEKYMERSLEEKYNAMLAAIHEQKKNLEELSNAANHQRNIMDQINNNHLANEKKLKPIRFDIYSDVDVKRKRIVELETIERDIDNCLRSLCNIEPQVRDPSLKEFLVGLVSSNQRLQSEVKEIKFNLMKKLDIHENVLRDLQYLQNEMKEKSNKLLPSSNYNPVIDDNYLNKLDHDLKGLSIFLKDCVDFKVELENKCQEIIKDSSNPADINLILTSIQTIINGLGKNIEKIKDEWKSGQDILTDWDNTYYICNETMERIERSLNEEIVPMNDIEGKEKLLEKLLDHKQCLEDFRTNFRHLEKLNQSLNNHQYSAQLTTLKHNHRDLQNRNSTNYSQTQKSVQIHRDYAIKMLDIERRVGALNIEQNENISSDSTKYALATFKKYREKAQELENELKRMEARKNNVISDSSLIGRDLINWEFSGLMKKVKDKIHIAEENINKLTNDTSKLDACEKKSSSLELWIKAKRKLLQINSWDSDVEAVKQKINELKMLNAEATSKYNEIEETRKIVQPLSIDPSHIIHALNELETGINDIKDMTNEYMKEGEELKKCLLTSKDIQNNICRKFDIVKEDLKSIHKISNPNDLYNEIQKVENTLRLIQSFKPYHDDLQAVLESLPRTKSVDNIHKLISTNIQKNMNEHELIERDLHERKAFIESKVENSNVYNKIFTTCTATLDDLLAFYNSIERSLSLEDKLKKEEELLAKIQSFKPQLDQLTLVTEQSGFQTYKESSASLSSKYARVLDDLNRDIAISQEEIFTLTNYQSTIHNIELQMESNESAMHDIYVLNFSDIDDVSNSKLRAIDLRKNNLQIQDNLYVLEQEFGKKIKLSLLKQKSITMISELKERTFDFNKEVIQYIEKCDSELYYITEYNEKNTFLQESINQITSSIINVEKSGELLPENFAKIKNANLEIADNENILCALKSTIKQSHVLSRSPKVNLDVDKMQKKLFELKERHDVLLDLVNKEISIRDKYISMENYFSEQFILAQEKVELADRRPLDFGLIQEIQSLSDKLHEVYQEMTIIINDEMDHHSDRSLEYSRDHKIRSNNMNLIDSKIHNFRFKLNQRKEHQARWDKRNKVVESNIKNIESQLNAIPNPKDTIQLQSNVAQLKFILHEIGVAETEIKTLTNDILDNQHLEKSCKQLNNQNLHLKTKAEQDLRDAQKAELELKEHGQTYFIAQDFVQQCQKRFEGISMKSTDIHQLENELQKLNDLISSLGKNKILVANCSNIEITNIRCLSDNYIEKLQKDIGNLNTTFEELQDSVKKAKNSLDINLDKIKQEKCEYENLLSWLRKEEKELKLVDEFDGVEAVKNNLEHLKSLRQELQSKQGEIDLLDENRLFLSNSCQVKECFESVVNGVKSKIVDQENIIINFNKYCQMLSDWSLWYDKIKPERNTMNSLLSNDRRNFIQGMLSDKNKKYDEMVCLASIGELLIPKLTIAGRNQIKMEVKSVKSQWHETFDDLALTLENLEEKIQKNDTMKEMLERARFQFDRTHSMFKEEVIDTEPLAINFKLGIQEKEKQLRKIEIIKQNLSSLNYTIQKLETMIQSDDKGEIEFGITSFSREYHELSNLVNSAKDLISESYKINITFEDCFLQAEDAIKAMEKKVTLCANVRGTSMSLQSRIERIQLLLTKELINTDKQDDRVFNNLTNIQDRFEKTICEIERETFKERVKNLLDKRKALKDKIALSRLELESSFTKIEEFKTKYELTSKEINNIHQKLPNNQECDQNEIKKVTDQIENISKDLSILDDLALEIFQCSQNQLPLDMTKNLQKEFILLSSKHNQTINDFTNLSNLEEQFNKLEKELNECIKQSQTKFDDLTNKWNVATKISDCVNIFKEINHISSETIKTDLVKEALEKMIIKFHSFPIHCKKNSIRFSILNSTYNSFYQSLNEKKSSFELIIDEYKEINDKLENLWDELESLSLEGNDNLPETKLEKFNSVNDLHYKNEHQCEFNKKANEIDTKAVNNKNLSDQLLSKKMEITNKTEKNIKEIEKRLKNLSTSFLDQEHLEKEISIIKESIYCIEDSKLGLTSHSKINSEIVENKINETDKMLSVISSIKSQIEKNLISTRIGCASEINELRELKRKVGNLDLDFKSLKATFNTQIKRYLTMENDITTLDRELQYLEGEINSFNDYGTTLDNKIMILKKCTNIKKQIFDKDEQLQNLVKEVDEIRSGDDGTMSIARMSDKLEKQYKFLKERAGLLINRHEESIKSHETFENVSKELKGELLEMQSSLQNVENQSNQDLFMNMDNIRDSVNELKILGEKSQKFSSDEGKLSIARKLDDIKNCWKNIEKLYKQHKIDIEKEKIKLLEIENQRKHFRDWLNNIKEKIFKEQSYLAEDVEGKRKKHFIAKGILNDIQEWKKEMSKYFDILKETKSNENEMEILKDYRNSLSNINFQISETKLALDNHVEFKKKTEEFTRMLDVIENQILEFSPQTTVNLDEKEKQLKKFFIIRIQLNNEISKLVAIKQDINKVIEHSSKEGIERTKTTAFQLNEKYEQLKIQLKKVIEEVETEINQLTNFESLLKTFEIWLTETEEKFTSRSFLPNIKEKETKLNIYQNILLSICDKKETLDGFLEEIKVLPLNLAMHHSLRGLQIRYSSLSNLAGHQVELVAKWEATHRHFLENQKEFIKESSELYIKMNDLKENIELCKNVEQLIQATEEIERKIVKIEEIKVEYESSHSFVIQETSSDGHDEINKQFIKDIQKYNDFIISMKTIKMSITQRQTQESRVKNVLECVAEWIQTERQSVSYEVSPQIHILTIKNNLNLLDTFRKNVETKISILSVTKKENDAIKDEEVIKRFSEVERELLSFYQELKDKAKHSEILLELNEKYYTLYDNTMHWIEEMSIKVKLISNTKGTESEIDERMNSIMSIKNAIATKGKFSLNEIIDSANAFMKFMQEKISKERTLKEVNNVEEAFLDLTKTSEQTEDMLRRVSNQWTEYRRNIDNLEKFFKRFKKQKEALIEIQKNYSSDIDDCIEKFTELINCIRDEKMKLEMFLSATHSLKEISQEPLVEVMVQDFMDLFIEQEIDCKYQLDRIYQLKNEKTLFDQQYSQTKEWIQNIKIELIFFDQLHNVPSFTEFQKHFSNFQLLETKIIHGDRLLDDCLQISHKLSTLCDSEKELNEIMIIVQKSWNNLKEKFGEIRSRLSRLVDIWAILDNLYLIVEEWTEKTNKEVESLIMRGYVNTELKEMTIEKLKELNSNSELIKPKLSKVLEFLYKAEAYSAFTKTGDPLMLQKRFCHTLEKISDFQNNLQHIQTNIDKFQENVSGIEKWILDTSLIMTDKCQAAKIINSIEEIGNQLKFVHDLRQQTAIFEEENIKDLKKLKEIIDKQLLNRGPMKSDIDSKFTGITQSLEKLKAIIEKYKRSLKLRSGKLKQFQSFIQNAESLIYTELPDWWITKELTTTMSPENCEEQIQESLIILDRIVSIESDFHQVWLDYSHQHQLANMSQSFDGESKSSESILSQNFKIVPDNHIEEIRAALKKAKEKFRHHLEELKEHKEKWLKIEKDIEELESLFAKKYYEIEHISNNEKEDDILYDQIEKFIKEIINNRQVLERLHNEINDLNGNNDYSDVYGTRHYSRYSKLCKNYGGLLHKIEVLKNNLRSFNVHMAMENILRTDLENSYLKKPYTSQLNPQNGTQTNRNKSTSIRTLKRHLSNPNLMLFNSRQQTETVNDLRKSLDTSSMTVNPLLSKKVQTVNDVGVQSKNMPMTLSEYADKVMQDKISFDKIEPFQSTITSSNLRHISNNKREHKEDRFRRLDDLLSTIQQIKDDISSTKSYKSIPTIKSNLSEHRSPTRSSLESVRHNIKPTSKNKKVLQKQKRSKSRESLGSRPSPTGCASPKSVKGEFSKKRTRSPKKSPTKSNSSGLIAF